MWPGSETLLKLLKIISRKSVIKFVVKLLNPILKIIRVIIINSSLVLDFVLVSLKFCCDVYHLFLLTKLGYFLCLNPAGKSESQRLR